MVSKEENGGGIPERSSYVTVEQIADLMSLVWSLSLSWDARLICCSLLPRSSRRLIMVDVIPSPTDPISLVVILSDSSTIDSVHSSRDCSRASSSCILEAFLIEHGFCMEPPPQSKCSSPRFETRPRPGSTGCASGAHAGKAHYRSASGGSGRGAALGGALPPDTANTDEGRRGPRVEPSESESPAARPGVATRGHPGLTRAAAVTRTVRVHLSPLEESESDSAGAAGPGHGTRRTVRVTVTQRSPRL